MMMKRWNSTAQISLEYLLIIGISLAILIPTSLFFYQYTQSSNEGVIRSQIAKIGNTMLKNSEQIYGMAEGSRVTVDMDFPANINSITVLNKNEIVIQYELSSGTSEAVFYSPVDITTPINLSTNATCTGNCTLLPWTNSTLGTFAEGLHHIKFESETSFVLMSITS